MDETLRVRERRVTETLKILVCATGRMIFPSFEKGKAVGRAGLGRKFRGLVFYMLVLRYILAFSSDR